MEEEEIELWYEEEKQHLSEQYIKAIEKGMPLDEREKKFTRAMEKLASKYEKKHAQYLRMKERSKTTQAIIQIFSFPLTAFKWIFGLLGGAFGGLGNTFKSRCAQMYFHFNIARIRHAYKIPDGFRSFARPFVIFHIKHLRLPLHIMAKPFVRIGRFISSTAQGTRDFFAAKSALVWKTIKSGAKSAVAHISAAGKKLSTKAEEAGKRYKAWQAKRIQADIDRKQKKKEEREKRTGKKEETEKLETV